MVSAGLSIKIFADAHALLHNTAACRITAVAAPRRLLYFIGMPHDGETSRRGPVRDGRRHRDGMDKRHFECFTHLHATFASLDRRTLHLAFEKPALLIISPAYKSIDGPV